MEDAFELANYLPHSFKTQNEQDYIAFLWDAFETNYQTEKYQFAFLPYHMLTMSFIYFVVWQIRENVPEDFEKATIGFSKKDGKILSRAVSPFAFSEISESSILRILKLINCDDSKIGKYTQLVRDRNNTAHANGNIFLKDQGALNIKIKEILRSVDEIQIYSTTVIQEGYKTFLMRSYDEEDREFYDPIDQIQEILIHGNYMSQKDIEICMAFDVVALRHQPGFNDIAALHQFLRESYRRSIHHA